MPLDCVGALVVQFYSNMNSIHPRAFFLVYSSPLWVECYFLVLLIFYIDLVGSLLNWCRVLSEPLLMCLLRPLMDLGVALGSSFLADCSGARAFGDV